MDGSSSTKISENAGDALQMKKMIFFILQIYVFVLFITCVGIC
jgi:hypothetical protein